MTKVLLFNIAIEGLEDKIWRKIEITDRRTVADFAYTVLASFNALGDHLYDIRYKDKLYDCWVAIEDYHEVETPINAVITPLNSINFTENDQMVMEYDTGTTTTFIITYLGKRDFEKGNGMHYPCVIDGAGNGMVNDLTGDELKAIVLDTDKKGYSEHYFTPGYRGNCIYDYREFDVRKNNLRIKRYFWKIKRGYEEGE